MENTFVILVAVLCSFGLGMCFSLLGSISVKLMPRLNIDQGKFGSLISVFMFVCLVASLIMGVTVDKIGFKPVAIFGFIVTAVCIFVLARGKSYQAVMGSCLLLGFGAMALNTAGNTMIPMVLFGGKDPAAAQNLGNVFFGLGLFLTPLIVSFLFRRTSYENAVSTLGVVVLIPLLFAFTAKYPQSAAAFELKNAVALLGQPAVLVSAFVLFCYIALESSFCNWIAPFSKEVISKDFPQMPGDIVDATSQRMLSVFAIAMMVGRFLASQIQTITQHGDVIIAVVAIVAGLLIFAMTRTGAIWTSALIACAGLAFAPCFPTTVGVTFSKFTPDVYGSVFGIIFAIGLLGAVIVPKAIGNMAKGSSIQKSLRLLIPACILLVFLALVLGKIKGPVS